MSNREKFQDKVNELNSSLNDETRAVEVDTVVKNFDVAKSHLFTEDGEIKGGFKTIVNASQNVVDGVKESKPSQVEDLSIMQLDKSASNKTIKTLTSDEITNYTAITGVSENSQNGFLDVVISAPYPEALSTALKNNVENIEKVEIETAVRRLIDLDEHDDPNIQSVIDNAYKTISSQSKVANKAVANILNSSSQLLKKSQSGFGSTIENLVEKTFRSAESILSPALYKDGIAKNITEEDLQKVVQFANNKRYDKAALILTEYSDKTLLELSDLVKQINNKASNNLLNPDISPLDLEIQRTDIFKNLWREENTLLDGKVLKPIIGNEITPEVLNLERDIKEVIVMFLPKKDTTVEEYHQLYVDAYNHGINQHFYIGYDSITYRGRPLEIESKNTRCITNNHFEKSIIIGINVDETSQDNKIKPGQVDNLVELLEQIITAKPGIQIFSAKDVGWVYDVNTEALDIQVLLKSRLKRPNSEDYDPKTSDPLDQETLATLEK